MWRYLGIQVMDVSEDHRVALVLGAVVLVRGLWAGLCNFEAGVTPADCFLSLSLSPQPSPDLRKEPFNSAIPGFCSGI